CRNILLCTSDKKQAVGYTIVIHTCVMQDKGESMSGHIPELQMRIVATPNLTRSYLQKLGRQNYLATASSIAIITVSFIWLLFHIGGDHAVTFVGDSMYAVTAWIGASWACVTALRARYGPVRLEARLQLAWLLIAIGM